MDRQVSKLVPDGGRASWLKEMRNQHVQAMEHRDARIACPATENLRGKLGQAQEG